MLSKGQGHVSSCEESRKVKGSFPTLINLVDRQEKKERKEKKRKRKGNKRKKNKRENRKVKKKKDRVVRETEKGEKKGIDTSLCNLRLTDGRNTSGVRDKVGPRDESFACHASITI